MAGEIRDGHIRRVRGEPMPSEEEPEDEDDQVNETRTRTNRPALSGA